jgi:hypothetical protein
MFWRLEIADSKDALLLQIVKLHLQFLLSKPAESAYITAYTATGGVVSQCLQGGQWYLGSGTCCTVNNNAPPLIDDFNAEQLATDNPNTLTACLTEFTR